MKIIICCNTTWNLVNFRSNLILALLSHSYEVVAVAPKDQYLPQLLTLGCRFIEVPMHNQATNPLKDFLLLCRFLKIFFQERPSIYLSYTIKPNIYGSMAAHLLGIPVVNNISGLGSVFIKKNWVTKIVYLLYKQALSRSVKVFFQNKHDCLEFTNLKLIPKERFSIIPGSGVDLKKFVPMKRQGHHPFRFLLVARMIWDKGIKEYITAARILRELGLPVECCLLGFLAVDNPSAISQKQVDDWVSEGIIRYMGSSDDVREELANADCIVLPSFREGISKVLLEASAMARPIITTNVAGCKEVVVDGLNGYLCQVGSGVDLADKMKNIFSLSESNRILMGINGREKVAQEFDEQIVINKYLEVIKALR